MIIWGIVLQVIFALFVFLVPFGSKFFLILNDVTMQVIEGAFEGIRFLFGPLAQSPGKPGSIGFILAFQALPSIIFFAALMELLYYVGIMERLIGVFARIFVKVMGISGAESLCASAQIFLGIESNLTIRPYLKEMTVSELMVVLTTGMATIASSVLGFYVIILSGIFPTVAGHLISASILLAPAAIIAAKMIFPETGSPLTRGKVVPVEYQKAGNPIEAIINGSMTGVKMVVGIAALLIAFIGLVALIDSGFAYLGKVIGSASGRTVDLTLSTILGYVFYPFTVAMGVPLEDAPQISRILGERIIMTEVKSYQDLSAARSGRENSAPAKCLHSNIRAVRICPYTVACDLCRRHIDPHTRADEGNCRHWPLGALRRQYSLLHDRRDGRNILHRPGRESS